MKCGNRAERDDDDDDDGVMTQCKIQRLKLKESMFPFRELERFSGKTPVLASS